MKNKKYHTVRLFAQSNRTKHREKTNKLFCS